MQCCGEVVYDSVEFRTVVFALCMFELLFVDVDVEEGQ